MGALLIHPRVLLILHFCSSIKYTSCENVSGECNEKRQHSPPPCADCGFQSCGELAGAQRSLARKLTFFKSTNRLLWLVQRASDSVQLPASSSSPWKHRVTHTSHIYTSLVKSHLKRTEDVSNCMKAQKKNTWTTQHCINEKMKNRTNEDKDLWVQQKNDHLSLYFIKWQII